MGHKAQFTCDACDKDISTSWMGKKEYRMRLSCEVLPDISGNVTLVERPIIKEVLYFCDKICLKVWINK